MLIVRHRTGILPKARSTSGRAIDQTHVKKRQADCAPVWAISLGLIAQLLNGCNTAVLNALSLVVFPALYRHVAIAVGAFAIGGPVGQNGRPLCGQVWPSYALLICTWSFLFGGLLLVAAPNMIVLTLGRFATGFSSGFSRCLYRYIWVSLRPSLSWFLWTCPTRPRWRHLQLHCLHSSCDTRSLAGYDGRDACALCPSAAAAPFLYESPRWFLSNPHSAQAADALRQLYGLNTDREVKLESAISQPQTCNKGASSGSLVFHAARTVLRGGSGDGSGSNKRVSGGGVGGGKRAIDVPHLIGQPCHRGRR